MKYSNVLILSLAVMAVLTPAQSKFSFQMPSQKLKKADEETTFRFVNEVIKNSWAGFLNGWYHSSANKFIPTEACFGDWIEEDFSEIQEVGLMFYQMDFMNMQFEDVSAAAVDIVEIFFKQDEHCGFRRSLTDLGDFCEKSATCKPDAVLGNLQKNVFQIVTKLTMVAELIQKSTTIKTNSEIYEAIYDFGQVFGGILASLINFRV